MKNIKKLAACFLTLAALTMYGCAETEVDRAMAKAARSRYYTAKGDSGIAKKKTETQKTTAATQETTKAAEATTKAAESKTTKAAETAKSTDAATAATKAQNTTTAAFGEKITGVTMDQFKVGDSIDTVFAVLGEEKFQASTQNQGGFYIYDRVEGYGRYGGLIFYVGDDKKTIMRYSFSAQFSDDEVENLVSTLDASYGEHKELTENGSITYYYTLNPDKGYNYVQIKKIGI